MIMIQIYLIGEVLTAATLNFSSLCPRSYFWWKFSLASLVTLSALITAPCLDELLPHL